MRLIAAVSLPRFPLQVEQRRRPDLIGRPVVILAPALRAQTLGWASPEAEERGAVPGLPYRQAIALCHELVLLRYDRLAYEGAWEGILESLGAFTPEVESAELGLAYLGLDRRFVGAEGCRKLGEGLARALGQAWKVQVGVAESKFVAWVAAREAAPGSLRRVPQGEAPAFLEKQPVHLLPLASEELRRLEQLGLSTLGDLRRLPRWAVQAQFGPAGGRAWDLCWGQDSDSLRPRPQQPRVVEEIRFPAPVASLERLVAASSWLVQRLLSRPEREGRPLRQIRLRACLEGGGEWERVLTLKGPTGHLERLGFVVRQAFAASPPSRPVEALSLQVLALSQEPGVQQGLFRISTQRLARLREAMRELKARYGYSPLGRIMEVEPWSRLPERRYALIELDL